ncbi:MAG: hypothetical protein JW929_01730 [Anaerolineales bacterium]|nr:hypothetical protein [Anaerolineales bacterium]
MRFRFRRTALMGAVCAAAGIACWTSFLGTPPKDPAFGPQDEPPAFPWGEGEMQFVRLSREDGALIQYTQVLVDREGTVYLFWQEEYGDGDYRSYDYLLRRRRTDGSWDAEERIENSELNFDPFFLMDDQGRPCFTYYEDADTAVLGLNCRVGGGWMTSNVDGYADLINHSLSLFLDPPRIVTAYITLEGSYGILHFNGKPVFRGIGDISGVRLAHDGAGTYYLLFWMDDDTVSAAPMMISESMDRGQTWSAPAEIFRGHGGEPKFFLGRDGTLYLAWTELNKLILLHHPPSAEWIRLELPFDRKYAFFNEDIFLGESDRGILWIALWDENGMHTLHGTAEEGFGDPVPVLSGAYSEYWMTGESAVFNGDGSLYFTGVAYDRDDIDLSYAVFGWI